MGIIFNTETKETKTNINTSDYKTKSGDDIPPWITNPTPEQIAEFTPGPTDEQIKQNKIIEIDNKISYEMTRGYEFNGGIMSTSPTAQINWSNILNRYNAGITIKMPFPVSLKNGGVYMIANIEDVVTLFKNASEDLENRHNVLLLQRAEIT